MDNINNKITKIMLKHNILSNNNNNNLKNNKITYKIQLKLLLKGKW
jgi:hypothetical protein